MRLLAAIDLRTKQSTMQNIIEINPTGRPMAKPSRRSDGGAKQW